MRNTVDPVRIRVVELGRGAEADTDSPSGLGPTHGSMLSKKKKTLFGGRTKDKKERWSLTARPGKKQGKDDGGC